ncbi:uncharacterized protein LOC120345655 [Styela clava]
MIFEAKASLTTFIACLLWSVLYIPRSTNGHFIATCIYFFLLISSHLYVIIFVLKSNFSIFWRSYGIGGVFLLGLALIFHGPQQFLAFGLYLCIVAFFHISEYLATALFNPSTLTLESFLINHSFAYNLAHLLCVIEYVAWCWLYPSIKLCTSIQILGIGLCLFGEVFRKAAMYTAGINFTHLIQYQKRREHELVTSGIYSICRHPSYAGWFCWSIATQVLACNPVCFIGYAIVSWKFFDERIYEEEALLLNFFQSDYLTYQQKVPSGVPFVKGFHLKPHNR